MLLPMTHQPITGEELEAMKARCKRATDLGPWASMCYFLKEHLSAWDVDFIAHARTDLPRCIAEIERLRSDLEVAKGALHVIAFGGRPLGVPHIGCKEVDHICAVASEALSKISPKPQ